MDPNPKPVVNGQPTPGANGENGTPSGNVLPPAPIVTPPTGGEPAAPGSKTPPDLLLKSLQEAREKIKELQEALSKANSAPPSEAFSDEGKLLEKQIKELSSKIVELEAGGVKKELQEAHPILKEKWSDFESYWVLPENKGMSMRTAAKAYLIENGQMDKPRPGLENPTGGPRTPITPDMSAEDVKELREKDPRKYREMLEKGQIKI